MENPRFFPEASPDGPPAEGASPVPVRLWDGDENGTPAPSRSRRRDARSRPRLNSKRLLDSFVDAPRWLLLIALVFAPWAYGSTRPWAIQILDVMLGSVCLLWAVECLLRRRRPDVPLAPALLCAGLLAQGWWMALNAHHHLDPVAWQLLPNAQWITGAPGSADGATSIVAMFGYSAMLGAMLFSCDLALRPVWRKRLWVALAGAGCSIALFGVIQKIGGDAILALTWEPEKRDLTNNFALFRCRNNAGAFLNLALPLLGALTFVNLRRPDRPWIKALCVAALLVVLAGIQLNPSRASWVIALGLLMALAVRIGWHYWRRRADLLHARTLLTYAALCALSLGAIGGTAVWGGWLTGWQRMQRQGIDLATRQPIEIYRRMVPDAGLTGYGPGTFQVVFPSYQATHDFGGRTIPKDWVTGRWIHAHQDYLQTLIEWGWLGTLLWGGLIGGGLVAGAGTLLRLKKEFTLRWLLFAAVLALAGALVHAGVDFPLQVASIQVNVAVLLGLCWGARA